MTNYNEQYEKIKVKCLKKITQLFKGKIIKLCHKIVTCYSNEPLLSIYFFYTWGLPQYICNPHRIFYHANLAICLHHHPTHCVKFRNDSTKKYRQKVFYPVYIKCECLKDFLLPRVRGFWSWFGGVCSITYCNGNFRFTLVSEPFNVIL